MIYQTEIHETDWLASDPIFYNEKTGKVSRRILDVVDFSNLDIHPEGFNHYLQFGFSVFQQTPIRDIKFLPPNSRLTRNEDASLLLEPLPDVLESTLLLKTEKEILGYLEAQIHDWENRSPDPIVVPSTSGYDSRLLQALSSDHSRLHAFTFGRSTTPEDCKEIRYAQRLARVLDVRWESVALEPDYECLNLWYDVFGPSTNAYHPHVEFYAKIRSRLQDGLRLMSGIVGDAWAGGVKIPPVSSPDGLPVFAYTRWVGDSEMSRFEMRRSTLAEEYWDTHGHLLGDESTRIIEMIRFKMIFLCFLFRVPASFGFRPWSPYLEPTLALSMLNLPPDRRQGRRWQREFFQRNALELEAMKIPCRDDVTGLPKRLAARVPRQAYLDATTLREVVNPAYVEWINRFLSRASRPVWSWLYEDLPDRFSGARGLWRAARYLRRKDDRLRAYYAFTILKPIELLLRQRDKAVHE